MKIQIFIKAALVISIVFCMSFLHAQTDSLRFPAAWQGEWIGDLIISNGGGELQRLPMILKISPVNDSTYTYTIVYGEDTAENTRPYFLIERDQSIGHYKMDEDNGIILDDFFINNKLYSRFEVMGTLLLSTLEKRDDHLIYEIIAGPSEPILITGDTIINNEEIPPVNNYGVNVQQRAILTKKDE